MRAEIEAKKPVGFTVITEAPWVVAGDEPPEQVRECAEGTVRWATTVLKHQLGFQSPEEVRTIWLLKDDDSYRRNAWRRFRDEHNALVMSIATGGTMLHEMVLPMLQDSF